MESAAGHRYWGSSRRTWLLEFAAPAGDQKETRWARHPAGRTRHYEVDRSYRHCPRPIVGPAAGPCGPNCRSRCVAAEELLLQRMGSCDRGWPVEPCERASPSAWTGSLRRSARVAATAVQTCVLEA